MNHRSESAQSHADQGRTDRGPRRHTRQYVEEAAEEYGLEMLGYPRSQ